MKSREDIEQVLNQHVSNKQARAKHKQQAIEAKEKYESKSQEEKSKMHSDFMSANKEIANVNKGISDSIDNSTTNLAEVLNNLVSKVGLKVEVPELFNGDEITKAIDNISIIVNKALSDIVSNINKIKLEIKPTDLTPHTKKLVDSAELNNAKLLAVVKQAISDLNKSVKEITLEQEPNPIEWEFKVSRDKKGYIESVNAIAYYGEE
jgi:hypothetical protein